MNILLIAATEAEIAPSIKHIQAVGTSVSDGFYEIAKGKIRVLITGLGMMETTYRLTKELARMQYDLVIQAGIAGSFDKQRVLGSVVFVSEERYGDMGAEDKEVFIDIFSLGFANASQKPFTGGWVKNENLTELPSVKGITVNKVSGSKTTISERVKHYQPEVESMEGVALHFVCAMEQVKYMQIRGISNYVEERNKANWEIKKAVQNMNEWLMQYLTT